LISEEEEMSIRGLENVRQAVGKPLTGARRYVLGLGRTNDAFGHGITELTFEDTQIVIRPGPNEDYLVVDTGPLDPSGLNREYWTEVDLVRDHIWQPSGRLKHVDVFTDGIEDVALVFHFDSDERFSVVLCDTDVAIGRELELFGADPNKVLPVFRARIAA
jgi:hypothetical protein